MMGSLLTRALVMVLGYAYPAYECYKAVELNKPEIEQLRFWCQYWILVALLTVFERVGDTFVSWLPMYCEAKLAFYVYLWYPRTRGTTYVYDTFFRPYISKHETEIDRNLLELRTRAGDMVVLYWQKTATYGQTRFFEILQYVASQSSQPSRPRSAQNQQVHQPVSSAAAPVRQSSGAAPVRQSSGAAPVRQSSGAAPVRQSSGAASPRQPSGAAPVHQPSSALKQLEQQTRVPLSPTKSQQSQESNRAALATAAAAAAQPQASTGSSSTVLTSNICQNEEATQTDAGKLPTKEDSNPSQQEIPPEEAIRVTRARLRKRFSNGTQLGR